MPDFPKAATTSSMIVLEELAMAALHEEAFCVDGLVVNAGQESLVQSSNVELGLAVCFPRPQ